MPDGTQGEKLRSQSRKIEGEWDLKRLAGAAGEVAQHGDIGAVGAHAAGVDGEPEAFR
jgi:hypothetical protein